jgi:outer membrane protein assembly factor BamB
LEGIKNLLKMSSEGFRGNGACWQVGNHLFLRRRVMKILVCALGGSSFNSAHHESFVHAQHGRNPNSLPRRSRATAGRSAVVIATNRLKLLPAIGLWIFVSVISASAQYGRTVDGTNLWTVEVGLNSDGSPALAPDGTIYTGSWSGEFFAVEPGGKIKWKFNATVEIKSSPAIARDGTVYFGCRNNKFYALNPNGKLKWSFTTKAWVDSSPAIATDGTIYFGSWDKNFYALNPDGSKKWAFATGGEIVSSPAIARDGTIYFGSHDKKFYALNPDGSKRWEFTTGGPIISSPAIGGSGTVFFTSIDGKIYSLNPDGALHWSLRTGGITESSPVIGPDGMIYLGINNWFAAVTPDGKLNWQTPGNEPVDMTPAVAADHIIYFGSRDQAFFAILPTPERKEFGTHRPWGLWLQGPIISSPVIAPDNIVYVLNSKNLNAIQGGAPPAKSSWPMFRGNPRHTGNVTDNTGN